MAPDRRRLRSRIALVAARGPRRLVGRLALDSYVAYRLERLVRWLEDDMGDTSAQRRKARLRELLDHGKLDDESAALADRFTPVVASAPLALVSQAPRSGGTLMLRLFDGHSACPTVPHELSVMLPADAVPRDADAAFEALTPLSLYRWHASGVKIGWSGLSGKRRHVRPFRLSPLLAYELFHRLLRSAPPQTDRDVLDAYFTAYFSAWSDAPRIGAESAWIVGFEPGAVANDGRMARYFGLYPEGKLVSVVRDPWSWFVSASAWKKERFATPEVALRIWLRAARGVLNQREARPGSVMLVGFDDLVLDTRTALASVCGFLGVDLEEGMLSPTLGGAPADTNSSFADVGGEGVAAAPALNRRAQLDRETERRITAIAGEVWERVQGVLRESVAA